jgi:hypothetical protein
METYQDKRIALDNFYILSALKITITPTIKRQALEAYREFKKLPVLLLSILYPDSYGLYSSDEEWFIRTQLKVWANIFLMY